MTIDAKVGRTIPKKMTMSTVLAAAWIGPPTSANQNHQLQKMSARPDAAHDLKKRTSTSATRKSTNVGK